MAGMQLSAHVEREFARLGSANTASVRVKSVGDWCVLNI